MIVFACARFLPVAERHEGEQEEHSSNACHEHDHHHDRVAVRFFHCTVQYVAGKSKSKNDRKMIQKTIWQNYEQVQRYESIYRVN